MLSTCKPPVLSLPKLKEQLQIIVSSGPFTYPDIFDVEPLIKLIEYFAENEINSTKVVLVASMYDVHHHNIYPTSKFHLPKHFLIYENLFWMPDLYFLPPRVLPPANLNLLEEFDFPRYRAILREERLHQQQQQAEQHQPEPIGNQQHNDNDQQPQQVVVENADDEILRCYDWKCKQCENSTINIICRPCNCVTLCNTCADLNLNGNGNELACLLCTQRVNNYDHVFMDNTDSDGNTCFYYIIKFICQEFDRSITLNL
ncbi:hypothetical protein HCN44_003494 [Aphidius gifuensis]|uniref:Uncharacterized protein n=1 Tax=Aphidius gifuensis TaxID=684658 RepID=A0A834XMW0_APHGI|nr:hypothetical protein HCN44_003494 [Aphidius gifuensis]